MDMSQYRELFVSESREHLRSIGDLVVRLESEAADREKIDSLFRAAHSLKGMASSMGYSRIAELAHKLEDFMDRFRKEELTFNAGAADLLLEGSDIIEAMIQDVESGGNGERDINGLKGKLAAFTPLVSRGTEDTAVTGDGSEPPPEAEPPAGPTADAVHETDRGRSVTEPAQTVRVRTEILDNLINITGELITTKHRLMTIGSKADDARLQDAITDLSRQLRELHDEVMLVRMLPFAAISDRFPRMIRDLARKGGKDVSFEIIGKEIEFDRGILEELANPLIHILRNAVDHGLENEAERSSIGKHPQGKISLTVGREKDLMVVTVADDGRGMSRERLIETAIARGIVRPEEGRHMSQREALMLTCIPGFSTASEVTDVSGRGVGMDAVRATVRSLGGSLAIESEVGRGSRFILKLPLTITIINVLLAEAGNLTVAIPVSTVIRTLEVKREMIDACGRQYVFHLDDEPLRFLPLDEIFGLPSRLPAAGAIPLFVSEVKGRRIGLAVDRFLGQQEVFVKPLGRPLDKMKGLAGGAILGSGQVVFILDVPNLI